MARFILTWEAEWSNRKVPMISRDIEMFVKRQGGKNVRVVEGIRGAGEPIPAPKVLHLGCTDCAGGNTEYKGWYAENFEVCPQHGRRGVVKMETGRVEIPAGATLGFAA